MRVVVIGLGYVGFPTACLIADSGHSVLGVDANQATVRTLASGGLHIQNEHGLRELAGRVLGGGQLHVSEALIAAEAFIIAVPTPVRRVAVSESGFMADLSCVEKATRDLARVLLPGSLVILESTVPPGTTSGVVGRILAEETGLIAGKDFYLAHAPERVLPGNVLDELVSNDRVVGGVNEISTKKAAQFYSSFVQGSVLPTDVITAEMVKLMENTYRDVNIALANEFALISEKVGIDVYSAIELANRHPRVKILRPGPGVGGHCVAVDPYFLIGIAPELAGVIRAARIANSGMPSHVVNLCLKSLAGLGEMAPKIAILGASYKSNVGDERESPSLEIAGLLRDKGIQVSIHDPYLPCYSTSVEETLRGSTLFVLATDHSFYRYLSPPHVLSLMKRPLAVDTRGFLGCEWENAGFKVCRLGGRSSDYPKQGES